MDNHETFLALKERSARQQQAIRRQTYAPDEEKPLRRFSSWEIADFIFRVNTNTLRGKLKDPGFPQGIIEGDGGRQRWYSLEEINDLRSRLKIGKRSLQPFRPDGQRAIRVGIANFKGGAGKSTIAIHFAHAAALEGYRVLVVDFDPQATMSHSFGLTDVNEENTVWGILARDLYRETRRMRAEALPGEEDRYPDLDRLPEAIQRLGSKRLLDFIEVTNWPTIDIIPSCANAAFVEFASASYRAINRYWTFFGAVSRYLDALPRDAYDIIIFDCPPAIGYQSMNAVVASDILYIPSGPAWWEYDSTTSFIGQLGEALEEIVEGYKGLGEEAGIHLPKEFAAIRFLLTKFEDHNQLHRAMLEGFENVFGARLAPNPVRLTTAVEQSGRFLKSVYEMDYRDMTRDTWKTARQSFDLAYRDLQMLIDEVWPDLDADKPKLEGAA
ncbi:MAG: AAA family ATPase [Pseudomonadota bacterium]